MKKLILVVWLIIGVLSFSGISFKDIQLGMSRETIIQKVGFNYQLGNKEISYDNIQINKVEMKKVRFIFMLNSLYTVLYDIKPGNGSKVFSFLEYDFGEALEMANDEKIKMGLYSHIYSKNTVLIMTEDKKTKESVMLMLYEKDLKKLGRN